MTPKVSASVPPDHPDPPDFDPHRDGRPILVFLRGANGYARLLYPATDGQVLQVRLSPMKALALLALRRTWESQRRRMPDVRGFIPVAEGPALLAAEAHNAFAYSVDAFSKNLLKAQKAVDAVFDAAGLPRPQRLVEREPGAGLRLRPPGLRVFCETADRWLFEGDEPQPAVDTDGPSPGLAGGEATTSPDAEEKRPDADDGDDAVADADDGAEARRGPDEGRGEDRKKHLAPSLSRAARAG